MSQEAGSSAVEGGADVATDRAGDQINVRIDELTKIFQDDEEGEVLAVENLSLEVREGEFLVFVGPSGCGKTTTLRSVAGLETPTSGRILIGDRDVTGLDPRQRDVAMVFQNYALYPHKTVRDNMAFPLRVRDHPEQEIRDRVTEAARLLDISDLLDRRPGQLSGGQQQRVALGRAIVREPQVFLLDEPLSNLDAKLRLQMRSELKELHQRIGKTTIYVTHDQAEAMTLGDRVAVMRDGQLQQVGPPQRLYDNPANLFVAGFIGEPPMNFFDVEIVHGNEGYVARSNLFDIDLPERFASVLDEYGPDHATLGVRPEDLYDATFGEQPTNAIEFEGIVKITEPLGSDKFLTVADPESLDDDVLERSGDTGEDVITATDEREFTVRVAPESPATTGDRMTVAIDLDTIHLFDDQTGENFLADDNPV